MAGGLLRLRGAHARQALEAQAGLQAARLAECGLPAAPHAPRVTLRAAPCYARAPHTPVAL